MKDWVLIRCFHCLQTHWNRTMDLMGSLMRMLMMISKGRNGFSISLAMLLEAVEVRKEVKGFALGVFR